MLLTTLIFCHYIEYLNQWFWGLCARSFTDTVFVKLQIRSRDSIFLSVSIIIKHMQWLLCVCINLCYHLLIAIEALSNGMKNETDHLEWIVWPHINYCTRTSYHNHISVFVLIVTDLCAVQAVRANKSPLHLSFSVNKFVVSINILIKIVVNDDLILGTWEKEKI